MPVDDLALRSSSPRRIRASNERSALQALYRHRRLSRAELARKLGLNRSSSGSIIAELAASGLVREVEAPSEQLMRAGRAGRPGILLELVPDAACFLGAEIGVEHVTTVEIDLVAGLRACKVAALDGPSLTPGEAVALAVAQAFADLPPARRARCEGLGLSIPAQIDGHGRVRVAPLLGWREVALVDLALRALPVEVPVMVENDANAFALGEGYRDRDGRAGVTLHLVIESGIGGGIVIDGRLFRGGHGLAGEIGHLLAPEGGGAELEQLIGRERILGRHRAATGRAGADLGDLLTDLRQRVPHAVALGEDWARHLGQALVQACRILDPNRIVLGGAVAALYPLVADQVAAQMRAAQAPSFPVPEIVLDEGAATGSAFGAACMMHQRFLAGTGDRVADPDQGGDEPT